MSAIRLGVAQVRQTPDLSRNLETVLESMRRAKGQGVELLCFPETHLPGYRVGLMPCDAPCDAEGLSAALREISGRCRELSMGVIVGAETPNPPHKPFNSAVVLDQEGRTLALHH